MDKLRVTLKSIEPWKKLSEKMQTCWVGGMCMCMWHVHVHVVYVCGMCMCM